MYKNMVTEQAKVIGQTEQAKVTGLTWIFFYE